MSDLVILKVDGQEWSGWESASINDFFGKTLCSKFDLVLSDRWRADFRSRPIKTNMKCELWLGDELRLTGWIFKVSPGYGPNRHLIRISGRDLTADLVDCSATVHLPEAAAAKGKGSKGQAKGGVVGAWTNRKLEDIARDLCAEFGVVFVAGDDTGPPIKQARLQLGETPFQILEKLCRSRNVWMASTVRGELTFLKASTQRLDGVLIRGQDIEDGDAEFSDEGRFSTYIGKAQQRGSDTIGPAQAAHVSAQVDDPTITRHRPLIIQGEDQHDGQTLADRLQNEMNKRIGDSRTLKAKLAGWRMSTGSAAGQVWPTNRRVAVSDDWMGMNTEMLIEQAAFQVGKTVDATTLTLVPPEKFDLKYTGFTSGPAIPSITDDDSRPWDRTQGPI